MKIRHNIRYKGHPVQNQVQLSYLLRNSIYALLFLKFILYGCNMSLVADPQDIVGRICASSNREVLARISILVYNVYIILGCPIYYSLSSYVKISALSGDSKITMKILLSFEKILLILYYMI